MNQSFRFEKKERIYLEREIDHLFDKGKSFSAYPLRVIYVQKKPFSGADVSILVSVPKKRFKHAVDRNRLKRLIRETYRLNKQTLLDAVRLKDKGLLIAFVYVGSEMVDYSHIEIAMQKALQTLIDKQG